MSWLEAKKLSFSYGGNQKILEDFSVSLDERGIYTCVGDSGVGKSTFSSLLAGHLRPDSGSIHLNGIEIRAPSRRVFLVSQEDDLFPWLRVEDQIRYFLQLGSSEWKIQDALALVELEGENRKFPAELSGGMRKRLSLLRATVLHPELLLLDETFSAIEWDLRKRILNQLSGYWKKKSTGVIIVSHDPLPQGDFPLTGEIRISRPHRDK